MSVIRLPLLCAFAGGCLSGAVLLGIWRADTFAAAPAHKPLAQHSELVANSRALTSAEQASEISDDQPARAPLPVAHAEPAIAEAEVAPAPAGSAVSDVLMDLEAAYRRRLAAAAPAEAPVPLEQAPAPANTAVAQAQPPALAAPTAVPVAAVPPPVALVAIAPAAAAPAALAPAELPPPVAAAPALVAQADSRPPDIHIGDINNTYITNVRQGDVYLMQQQVAMMQYMQLIGISSYGSPVGRPSSGAVHAARGAKEPFRQFPSTLTNLDNPWGFNLPPPNLVH
jgi:hypothetical protein